MIYGYRIKIHLINLVLSNSCTDKIKLAQGRYTLSVIRSKMKTAERKV